jgi:hypothetical protein
MERRPEANASDADDELSPAGEARQPDDAATQADPVQGWQEDEPTGSELEPDDGYHPEHGGPKYLEPDPVDEPLLARQEGLDEEEESEL